MIIILLMVVWTFRYGLKVCHQGRVGRREVNICSMVIDDIYNLRMKVTLESIGTTTAIC